jgi:hypothetical protein
MENENYQIQDYQVICWFLSVMFLKDAENKLLERQPHTEQPKNFDESWRELEALGVLNLR